MNDLQQEGEMVVDLREVSVVDVDLHCLLAVEAVNGLVSSRRDLVSRYTRHVLKIFNAWILMPDDRISTTDMCMNGLSNFW